MAEYVLLDGGESPYAVNGHEYARDRGPYDDPGTPPFGRYVPLWRRRWACSCGQTGDWFVRTEEQTHQDWRAHAEQAG